MTEVKTMVTQAVTRNLTIGEEDYADIPVKEIHFVGKDAKRQAREFLARIEKEEPEEREEPKSKSRLRQEFIKAAGDLVDAGARQSMLGGDLTYDEAVEKVLDDDPKLKNAYLGGD